VERVLVSVGEGKGWGKGMEGCIWCKYCAHMYINRKMIHVATIPGMGKWRMKENGGGDEFKYHIFDIL
jgi:hypothetical protein